MYASSRQNIYNEIATMKPIDKIKLIDKLILSLDIPNQTIEEQWNDEAKSRIEAYQNNQLKAIPSSEIFARYAS